MTHKCSEGAKCTCRSEIQSHDCMYRLRSPKEAMQDYKDNLAPPTEPVTSVPLEQRPGYDSLSGRIPEDRISLPYVVDSVRERSEVPPVIVDGVDRSSLTDQVTEQLTEHFSPSKLFPTHSELGVDSPSVDAAPGITFDESNVEYIASVEFHEQEYKKRLSMERDDIIRQRNVDRAMEMGIETTGKSYHVVFSELLDYIERVRTILNNGHL